VSEQTLQAPPVEVALDRRSAGRPRRAASLLELARRYPWVLGAIALVALATVIVRAAGTRPGYDPYGWLVWGHLTIHFNLDTNGAPSWKPLPFVFTVPYALVGHYALWLWMITSVAISLSGVVFAYRIAFRLTGASPERRYAAYAAGAVAAVALLGIRDYTHFILSAQSDTMIVSLCLGAIDCHLSGRRRWALWLAVLAGLGRPEVWPPLGLYAIWLWRSVPAMRRMLVAALSLIPLLWFGIPALTAKSWFVAGNIALKSPRALHENKISGTLDRFLDLHEAPVQLAALLALGLAAWRRQRETLLLAGVAVLWVLTELAFVLRGWPGVPRYLFEPTGVMCALAGIGIGRVILDLPPLIARVGSRVSPRRLAPNLTSTIGGLAAVAVIAVFAGAMVPAARSRLLIERHDLKHEQARARVVNALPGVIAQLGGRARIAACGQPTTFIGYQSVLAWDLGTNTGSLFWTPHLGRVSPRSVVLFVPLHNGWKVTPINVPAARQAQCRGLRIVQRFT
jgi:hypothetical protein